MTTVIADTSAWIAFLRGTESDAHRRLRQLIVDDDDLWMTDAVVMEVLAGARDVVEKRKLRRLLFDFPMQPVHPTDDFETAADIFFTCRRAGSTPRSLMDCLIAAVAIRTSSTVLHEDRDYEVIARHLSLSTMTA
jgi:predicted nucleic acid-binding protein